MASELRLTGELTGSIIYAVLVRDSDELVWQTTTGTFVTRESANHTSYDIALTETPPGSRIWLGDFPAGISDDGTVAYHCDYYKQAGAGPASTDPIVASEDIYSAGNAATASPATSTLLSLAEYRAVYPDAASTDAKLTFLLAAATAAIESYCDRTFTAQSRTETLDGTGYNLLSLGGVPAGVTSVTLDPLGPAPTVIDGAEFYWTSTGSIYFKPSSTRGGYFPAGHQNVRVVYTSSGVVPYDLKLACGLVVNAMERMADAEAMVASKSVGDVTIKYGAPVTLDLQNPVFAEARGLLARHVRLLCL